MSDYFNRIALFFIIAFSKRTKNLIKSRDKTVALEKEFNNTLFTLGNRLGDGTPAEIAFLKVAESTKGQKTSEFFKIVNSNIQSMGMSLEGAIFDPRRGALVYYPSNLIATSMRILIESVKKGLKVAAQSLMSISEYVKNSIVDIYGIKRDKIVVIYRGVDTDFYDPNLYNETVYLELLVNLTPPEIPRMRISAPSLFFFSSSNEFLPKMYSVTTDMAKPKINTLVTIKNTVKIFALASNGLRDTQA